MKNWIWIIVVLVAVATAFGADVKKLNGVFSGLKVGQHVKMTDHGTVFTISYFESEIEFPHKVVEIGENYIVVRDVVGIKEIRIPVYAVKSVVKVKMGVE